VNKLRKKEKKNKTYKIKTKKDVLLANIGYNLEEISKLIRYIMEENDKRNIIPNTSPKEFEFKRISENIFEVKSEFINDEGDSVGTMYLKGDIWYCLDMLMNMKYYRKDKKYEVESKNELK